MEVVDVEWKVGKDRFLRVYIDKPEGISHNDCQAVSEQLSVLLDVEDLIPGQQHYVLEVSSPGLDRKLTKPGEFERFAGRLARISTNEPVENQKFFEGRLAGVADGQVKIEVQGPGDCCAASREFAKRIWLWNCRRGTDGESAVPDD